MMVGGALSLSSAGSNVFAEALDFDSTTAAPDFKKSIMWGCVQVEGSAADKCKAIKAAGYDGAELYSRMDKNEMIAAMKNNGLTVSSVCCSKHWSNPISHPDAAVRQVGIDDAITALEDAKAYGTDVVLLVPGVVNETVGYDECWNRSTESIKKMLPVAEKLKVKICVENVWNNFLLSPLEACRFVDQFNSPYVGFYFDCGNILAYGWPEQWIRILGNRIGRIHIKDYSKREADKKGPGEGFNIKLTDGDVNWAKVLAEARKSYHGSWLTTEQGSSDSLDELKDLGKRFDKLLAM